MGSVRRRDMALQSISMHMLEAGKVLSKREYETMRARTDIRIGIVMNMFGSWSRMLAIMERSLPQVWAEIKEKENPKPVPPTSPKPKVKAAVKPAPAVKKDKDDE